MQTGPRLYCIPATAAPTVAVIRRGPSSWAHVARWDLDPPAYVAGSWLHGTLYPQRCDLSPDGRWFGYFTLDAGSRWAAGDTYVAISRLPWLTALAAWGTNGTWTRGIHFVADASVQDAGPPEIGRIDVRKLRTGIAVTRPASFAVERRRGWIEGADTAARAADDMWDERRGDGITMIKSQPGKGIRPSLLLSGHYAAFRSGQGREVSYRILDAGSELALPDAQWADWASDGALLVATWSGLLQIRDYRSGHQAVRWEYDAGSLAPDPQPPPSSAGRW